MTWGLNTNHLPRFGARAIIRNQALDIVRDRCAFYGEPSPEWGQAFDKVFPKIAKAIQKLLDNYTITPDSDATHRVEAGGWVCEMSARRSYGYLYLDVWQEPRA